MALFSIETLKISPEILSLVAEIDEFKGKWQEMGKLSQDRLSSLKKVATIESIGSSTRIEGSELSDKEVEAFLTEITSKSFESRDEQEVAGYALVCEEICNLYASIPFKENVIKQLHASLLKFSDKDQGHKGSYKKLPIRIEAFDSGGKSLGVLFETTSPLKTPIEMEELVTWTQDALSKETLHPLLVIGVFVVLFLAIHPFQDGNGRLSRLLTTLLLLKTGYLYVPYSSLESIIEANKDSYYLALQKTQKSWQNQKPDWSPWLLFFLRCLQRQKAHLEVKLEREKLIQKVLPPLKQDVLDLLLSHGKLGIGEIAVLTKANKNTLKKMLGTLVKETYLVRMGSGKNSSYSINPEGPNF